MSAQNAPPEKVTLESGRVLVLEVKTGVSSESVNKGDHLQLRLVRPVMSGSTIALPPGLMVPAHITEVRRAGKQDCKDGKISWKIDSATAVDGTKVSLVGLPWVQRSAHGDPVDTVHLKSRGDKVGRGFEYAVGGPLFAAELILFLPSGLAMGLGEGQPCGKQPGKDRYLGPILYAAVAKDVRITLNPPTTH